MSLFDDIRGQKAAQQPQATQQPQTPQEMAQMLQQGAQQLQRDPQGFVRQAGFDIPAGMTDMRQIALYLLNSGSIPQDRAQMARAMMQRMGLK